MPLVDLNSMGHEDLVNEAKYWALEPSNYSSDAELKKAIKQKREMNAADHPVSQADVESGYAKQADVPGAVGEQTKKAQKVVGSSKQRATVSRPTPGAAETKKQQASQAMRTKTNRPTRRPV